jgi:phosphate transport system substrate-binding protein
MLSVAKGGEVFMRSGWLLTINFHKFLVLLTLTLSVFASSVSTARATVKIGGTGAAIGSMRHLATEFNKHHPGTSIEVVLGLSGSGGLKALLAGAIDISVATRPLRDNERKAGAVAMTYGKTPFVFVVHPDTLTTNITVQQVADIYAGRMTHWSDGTPIRLILRPKTDSDTRILTAIDVLKPALDDAHARKGLQIAPTDQLSADSIEHVPGAFGTSTLALVEGEARQMNVLALDGIHPTLLNLKTGAYPLSKTISVVTMRNASDEVHQFIKFMRGHEARQILHDSGLLWIGGDNYASW